MSSHPVNAWMKAPIAALLVVVATGVHAQAPETIDPDASCTNSTCHSDYGESESEVVHPAAADGESCGNCHEPSGEDTQHAFELAAEPPELCYNCHDSKTEDMETVHPPVADGMCTTCHNPHQSDNPRMLEMPLAELCVMCHADAPFTGDKVTHGPVAEGQCIACHDPHAGHNPRMLRKSEPELCFGCHNKTQRDPQGRALPPAKTTFIDKSKKLHPPFASGECTMCHLPHAGPNHRLLVAPYPASFYSPFSEDAYVCFECHDSEAFAEPRTLDATEFRNGNLNLHYRHVNRDKGRTCRACHDPHGASRDRLIRERVPFGKRFITISKFELTATGGSCAPLCHAPVTYDRFAPAPAPFRVTAREGDDASAETLEALKAEFEQEQQPAAASPATPAVPAESQAPAAPAAEPTGEPSTPDNGQPQPAAEPTSDTTPAAAESDEDTAPADEQPETAPAPTPDETQSAQPTNSG